jgi:hypothetical protein
MAARRDIAGIGLPAFVSWPGHDPSQSRSSPTVTWKRSPRRSRAVGADAGTRARRVRRRGRSRSHRQDARDTDARGPRPRDAVVARSSSGSHGPRRGPRRRGAALGDRLGRGVGDRRSGPRQGATRVQSGGATRAGRASRSAAPPSRQRVPTREPPRHRRLQRDLPWRRHYALELIGRAEATAAAADDASTQMFIRGNAGLAALLTGDTDTAQDAFRAELKLCRELVVPAFAAKGLLGLGAIAADRGDFQRAARLVGAATAHVHDQNPRRHPGAARSIVLRPRPCARARRRVGRRCPQRGRAGSRRGDRLRPPTTGTRAGPYAHPPHLGRAQGSHRCTSVEPARRPSASPCTRTQKRLTRAA